MRKEKWNHDWKFAKGYLSSLGIQGTAAEVVCLPHDAMVLEQRTQATKNGGHTGYYPGGIYTYFKQMDIPEEWSRKHVVLEFEGVYETAMVYVNGVLAKTNLYGYTNFYVELDRYLNYGAVNHIRVVADNSSEENSRWYSGSGIYRNVNLYVSGLLYIPENGARIATVDADHETAVVEVCTDIQNASRQTEKLKLSVELQWQGVTVASDIIQATVFGNTNIQTCQKLTVKTPRLWSCEHPDLYDCVISLIQDDEAVDTVSERIGIRKLSLDAVHGLRINGEPVKLRGTCVHHDNGIIGAVTLEQAERRKCRLLKEAGFNSIRSSHHPASRAMLDACDEYGILVMDEMCDIWNSHKNNHDFALHFQERWEEIAVNMVQKDYNHPSVIFYCTGNEIPEIGSARGAEINRIIGRRIHELDHTRYTTNAMNGLNAAGGRILSMMQDIAPLLNQETVGTKERDSTGSNTINSFMGLMDGAAGDAFAVHPLLTEAIAESCGTMDVIGLNYLTGRHILETTLHPNKCIVGTETFPADIVRLWNIVTESEQVIGDFTWTGYDYIGEAGCGIFYYDGKQNFSPAYPDRLGYIGDINLAGYRRPISYLREIVYGLRKEPYIAVERMNRYGMEHTKTPWMFKDHVSSWTWYGYEGKTALVDVYSDADEVELFLNGTSLGKKPAGKDHGFTAGFTVTYEAGALTAVAYKDKKESGSYTLAAAKPEVTPVLQTDRTSLHADGADMAFLTIRLADKHGTDNLFVSKEVTIRVDGAGTLQGFGSANPSCEGSYQDETWETYDGYLLAAVRAGTEPGIITIEVTAEGCAPRILELDVQ